MNLDIWSTVAIVFLALEFFILMLVPLALFFILVRVMRIVNSAVPEHLQKGQEITQTVRNRTASVTDRAERPLRSFRQRGERLQQAVRSRSSAVADTVYGKPGSDYATARPVIDDPDIHP
ncbi:MAG: hypothetical protein H6642_15705 [Caldilineaceae bacterium]|nr:hypothetical protein [Caldilineaceae bacterium]MCB9139788.1 hypothetical protein [Caldilineaceae bacterium]